MKCLLFQTILSYFYIEYQLKNKKKNNNNNIKKSFRVKKKKHLGQKKKKNYLGQKNPQKNQKNIVLEVCHAGTNLLTKRLI